MRWGKLIIVAAGLSIAGTASAEDLRIDGVATINLPGAPAVRLDLHWRNAWNNDRNHDGVWLFFKYRGRHLRVAADGHRAVTPGGTALDVVAASDGAGVWVVPERDFRGDVAVRLVVALDIDPERVNLAQAPVHAYGVEMVYVAGGPFWLGDPGPAARAFGAVYRVGETGRDGMLRIESEGAIEVGTAPGQLTYEPGSGGYAGDVQGPIPGDFPKGTQPFWVMKYEVSQGDYVNLLNELGDEASYERAPALGRNYREQRGSIRLEGGRYVADHPTRPANFMTWDDQLAYTDWSALRPMTELEFTQAARGPREPVADEFPWGTAGRDRLERVVNAAGDLVHLDGTDEAALRDQTRDRYGASYWWVMDLAGNVWERVITFPSPDGRAYTGSHGDGNLGDRARATNDDWPHDYAGRTGHGYRGGGYYGAEAAWHEFNPYSPVAYRRFGGWSGAAPHRAYGYRAVRSANR